MSLSRGSSWGLEREWLGRSEAGVLQATEVLGPAEPAGACKRLTPPPQDNPSYLPATPLYSILGLKRWVSTLPTMGSWGLCGTLS